MSRKVDDFFRGKKAPSYILIEWKLEDRGGYLLTGIALTNKESQIREQDDTNNSIKYFTFTSFYREANQYDIKEIPIVKNVKEKIYIENYKDVREDLLKKEKSSNFEIEVFTEEDGKKYRDHLESFNIFQDEWKSIVLKVNESEGGVIEIFEKCKTSQQLMNDWILKSIEKVVNKEDKDQKKLEQMLENLVEEMISNEQFIYEKELYQQFLSETDKFLDRLNELISSIDKEQQLEKSIASLYYFLKREMEQMNQEIACENEKIFRSEQELKKIELEERSKDYYDSLEAVETLTVSAKVAEEQLEAVKQKLTSNEHKRKLQQAAREYGHIKDINKKIAGIETEIDKIKRNGENQDLIKSLEYSLKIAYENLVNDLAEKEESLKTKLEQKTTTISNLDYRLKEIDLKLSHFHDQKGAVGSKVEDFEAKEANVRNELHFRYERNLLGEIEQFYLDQFLENLFNILKSLDDENNSKLEEKQQLEKQLLEDEERLKKLDSDKTQSTIELTKIGEKIETYNKLELAIRPVLEKNELDFKNRFQHKENELIITNKINELTRIERELDLNAIAVKETISSLKDGTLHVSKEFKQWLMNNNIDFETGENYLRNQKATIKQRLVKENPILPYAFLLYEEDIEKLKLLDVALKIRQLVPILSYGDIGQVHKIDGKLVQFTDKLQFMSLHDHRMIETNNLDGYLQELKLQLNDINKQKNHYRVQIDAVREDLHLLKQFTYSKNDFYTLENQKVNLEKQIDNILKKIEELKDKQRKNAEQQQVLRERLQEIERLVISEEDRIEKFQKFIKANSDYLQHKQALKKYMTAIEKHDIEKETIDVNRTNLTNEKEDLIKENTNLKSILNEKKQKFKLYENANKADLLDQDIEILEERLKKLKDQISRNLDRLEDDLESRRNEREEKEENLELYQLEKEEYSHLLFDLDKLKNIESEIQKLDEEKDQKDMLHRSLEVKLGEANGRLYSAKTELKKLADLPIPKGEIKLNFNSRRKEGRLAINEAETKIKSINAVITSYNNINSKITASIDNIAMFEINTLYKIKKGVLEDYEDQVNELKQVRKENKTYESNTTLHFSNIKAGYTSKNNHIENILTGLVPLMEGAQSDKNKYYFVGERLLLSNESLDKLIKACMQRLLNLEKNKNDMVQHSYLHAKQVFDEIQKIAENSSIKLNGQNRPIAMLKINMQPLDEREEENRIKMRGYIESTINIIKKDMQEGKRTEEIRKKISKYMSTKELLNELSDLGKMTIYAYKIDINAKNSGYKSWEQVMKENSGGERFVSFFAVIVALMSYTRTSMKYDDDYERNKDTKVLIMDNPFGPISSEHLLKPLFKIAEKYKTQLICLTDLKQNSILNCFNLIYMIKIRQNVFGTREYIQLEQQIKENAAIEKDEMLEKAVFKAEKMEQIGLF